MQPAKFLVAFGRLRRRFLALGAAGILTGCPARRSEEPAPTPISLAAFEDVTETQGLHFRHHNGAKGRYYLPETMGAGCAFFDINNDGRADILLLNGKDWTDRPGARHTPALYRNEGSRFTNATRQSGLDIEMYAIGCAAADYDNDGWLDLTITGVGGTRLFHNDRGRFRDVTAKAGLGPSRWSSGGVWLDYDRDGLLDLFTANYVDWTPATDKYCTTTGKRKSYCTPQDYDGLPSALYRNRGDGTFEDVSRQTGIADFRGKSLGAVAFDMDGDGWQDIFVANDTEANFLFRNTGQGRFEEVGLQRGCAVGESGRSRAGMGVDIADLDGSGRPALAVTNFAEEGVGLFVQGEDHLFTDEAVRRNAFAPTQPFLGFGLCFLDANLDGWMDMFIANGHIDDDVSAYKPSQSHAQPPLLLLNRQGDFEAAPGAGSGPWSPLVGRGAAGADFDLDGRPDILISANGGAPRLLRNATPGKLTWVRLTLQGTRSNRSAIGARVTVRADGRTQTQWVRAGSSYGSQSELPLTFGLNGRPRAEEVTVFWPSGTTDRWTDLAASRTHLLREKAAPLSAK